MVKMLDLDRHANCPLWEALASQSIPWTGMRYACLNVLHAYCKVFDKKEIYDLIVRKTCQSCKCPREAHAIYQQQTTTVHERLGFKVVSPAESGVEARDLGYTWVPPGIRASSRINRYFDQLPVDKVPKIGTEGARYREQQIAYQLPKQDLSLQHCKHLEEQHEASFEDFVTARNEIALDIGYIKDAPYDEHCTHCEGEINTGEMVVAAPKFVESVMWHPRCFTCSTCNELLVDLTYCVHEDKIYCERHYAEMLKPRCAGCDEISVILFLTKYHNRKKFHYKDKSNAIMIPTHKMGDAFLPELGDLVFSVLIGYAGALEFLYVVRHLYHWSCNHINQSQNDADGLKRLQERMRTELVEAEAKEKETGMSTMKDGVLYKDGFRMDLADMDRLKAERSTPEACDKRKKEIEAELKRQREIEEQTRQQLAAAEAQLAQQRRQAAEEEEAARKLLEAERAREAEQRRREQEEDETRKLLERERQREEEERRREAEEELKRRQEEEKRQREEEEAAARKRAEEDEAQRRREAQLLRAEQEKAAKEAEEKTQKLLEAERQREQEQRKQEEADAAADNERRLLEAERLREAEQQIYEERHQAEDREMPEEEEEWKRFSANEMYASGKNQAVSDADTLNSIMQLLNTESERRQNEIEYEEAKAREREQRQRIIEENARKFLEADHEMEELLESVQRERRYSNTESAPQSPVHEEPCIRKTMSPLSDNRDDNTTSSSERLGSTVKIQIPQKSNEPYSVSTKPLLFKSISDDTQSFEPQSSLSAQPSEEYATSGGGGIDGVDNPDGPVHNKIDIQFSQLERPEPDGEDNNDNTSASAQYTEDYLRSLDGIKQRPLVREDGSGRRRAFKKRRSSGSSNSSFESRTSREEELKMFTSLEEEELKPKKEGEIDDYTPIKYSTSEPLLKVKLPRRRHKRSPAKDAKSGDGNVRGSLEMLDEEANTNPWGEVTPEHYKDMPFWKREKSMSIDEEAIEIEPPLAKREAAKDVDARNVPSTATFEEATHLQNEEAITALQRQKTKVDQEKHHQQEPVTDEATRSDKQTNLQTTPNSARERKSASPRLRRSPRVDEEMDQYEEQWNRITNESASESVTPTTPATPAISIQRTPDVAPWRDQHGLLMEGISDFYDFSASTNPSRSRSTSRAPSPAKSSSQPSTSAPKNVAFVPVPDEHDATLDVYDDTGNIMDAELTKANIIEFIDALRDDRGNLMQQSIGEQLQNVADTPDADVEGATADASRVEMNLLVQTLRVERQSRSRSRSPLPTADQLARSVKTRRHKLIEKNDKLFETLSRQSSDKESAIESPIIVIESSSDLMEEAIAHDNMKLVVEGERRRSRSRSRSPLPTPDNLQRSLETRRSKRIKQNDELSEKLGIDISASRTPSPTDVETEKLTKSPINTEEECSRESMNLLVDSLRAERVHSRSRSRSPLPTAKNLKTGLERRRMKKIQQNDALFEQLHIDISAAEQDNAVSTSVQRAQTAPIISIQCCDDDDETVEPASGEMQHEESEYSIESMSSLVESLRLQRSRSKSPMRRLERERTPEPSSMRVGLSTSEHLSEGEDEHERRSRTPSRSMSSSPTRMRRTSTPPPSRGDDSGFHTMLNLEASDNRTLTKCSEEVESILAEKQRQVDAEALRELSKASEEIELRTVTPVAAYESEDSNKLISMSREERLRQLRCSPTTPNYERTLTQEWSDVQRIKDEMLTSGFKRSTYVGESQDLGSEFVHLRKETARFRRSRSPSPSLVATETREAACERREVQERILSELVTASAMKANDDAERLGAKPKELRSMSKDLQETHNEELRRINAEFRRSRSQSRSPPGDVETKEMAEIEEEAAKREMEDRMKQSLNFSEFTRYLNAGFLDNERRASDSALIQKPEVCIQMQQLEEDLDVEPENYHHYRRYSLNQEQSVEEYPNDDYVFVSQIEIQTPNGTRTWIREDYYSEDFEQLNLIREEESGDDDVALTIEAVNEAAEERLRAAEEEETDDGSEDERQTVVEVEDEIDEDICDFNERGPADESHHEQSECEEAEREMDRYADRGVNDWQQVENIDELLLQDEMLLAGGEEEGAIGGSADGQSMMLGYDSDSAVIDEIYDEAIRNRKPSGILRDYDSILKEMQKNYMNNAPTTDGSEADTSGTSDSDRKKVVAVGRKHESGEPTLKFIKNERGEHELRYLGDATVSARQSTRLRMRYGYMPQLHASGVEVEDIEVDLNYKPKKEYNWRKNFKIDDDNAEDEKENKVENKVTDTNLNAEAEGDDYLDLRKFSLGGESITLFSQGAEGVCYIADESQLSAEVIMEEKDCANGDEVVTNEARGTADTNEQPVLVEKMKKKKNKKKLRKETRNNSIEQYAKDEDDSESQIVDSRRSSSMRETETASPKRSTKSRSRRDSRNSLTHDEATFSPRSSVGVSLDSTNQSSNQASNNDTTTSSGSKKKLKKRKKIKEADIKEEPTPFLDLTLKVPTASAAVSPGTSSINPLATLSPQNSICTPTSSLDSSETPDLKELISAPSTAEGSPAKQQVVDGGGAGDDDDATRTSALADAADATTNTTASTAAAVTVATRSSTTPTTTTKTNVDTFDILKDANFYPLF